MPCVRYDLDDAVAWIRLDRPHRLNAVTDELVDDLVAAFDRAADDGARVVILCGEGRAFCAGYDLKDYTPDASIEQARTRLQRLQDVTRRTVDFPGPVIAAIHGYALGAGAEFAIACDIVVAGADAVMGFPEVQVGLSGTNGSSALLPRLTGFLRAKELVLLGERVDAPRALEIDLATRVVPAGTHESAAAEIARTLASRPPTALRLAKRLLDEGAESTLADALDTEVEVALTTIEYGEANSAPDRFQAR